VREKGKANIGIITKKSKHIKIGNLSHIALAPSLSLRKLKIFFP
jgi:hypothetical protein